jgi:hypothetical protein
VLSCNPFVPYFDSEAVARTAADALTGFLNNPAGPFDASSAGWANLSDTDTAPIYIAYSPVTWSSSNPDETVIPVVELAWSPEGGMWVAQPNTISVKYASVGDRPDNGCTQGEGRCLLPPHTTWAFFAPEGEWEPEPVSYY